MPPKLLYKKPFDSREFLGWVNRYAKRKDFSNSRMINMGAYTLDTETHVLSFRGCNEKTLGNTEFATLKLLWINKGEVVPRQDLKDTVWRGVKCIAVKNRYLMPIASTTISATNGKIHNSYSKHMK